jgi:transcriptional regulator with XRE-family HTH domain
MMGELLVISFFLCYDLLEFNKEGCSVRFNEFPVIDQIATGKNILSLRKEKGLSVKDLQEYFGFEEPQAIYRWQYGKTLPSVDNLYALSALLDVPMERILVPVPDRKNVYHMKKQQEVPAAFDFLCCIHKEIGVDKTNFLFGSGFAHDQYHIGFRLIADRSILRCKEGLQVAA